METAGPIDHHHGLTKPLHGEHTSLDNPCLPLGLPHTSATKDKKEQASKKLVGKEEADNDADLNRLGTDFHDDMQTEHTREFANGIEEEVGEVDTDDIPPESNAVATKEEEEKGEREKGEEEEEEEHQVRIEEDYDEGKEEGAIGGDQVWNRGGEEGEVVEEDDEVPFAKFLGDLTSSQDEMGNDLAKSSSSYSSIFDEDESMAIRALFDIPEAPPHPSTMAPKPSWSVMQRLRNNYPAAFQSADKNTSDLETDYGIDVWSDEKPLEELHSKLELNMLLARYKLAKEEMERAKRKLMSVETVSLRTIRMLQHHHETAERLRHDLYIHDISLKELMAQRWRMEEVREDCRKRLERATDRCSMLAREKQYNMEASVMAQCNFARMDRGLQSLESQLRSTLPSDLRDTDLESLINPQHNEMIRLLSETSPSTSREVEKDEFDLSTAFLFSSILDEDDDNTNDNSPSHITVSEGNVPNHPIQGPSNPFEESQSLPDQFPTKPALLSTPSSSNPFELPDQHEEAHEQLFPAHIAPLPSNTSPESTRPFVVSPNTRAQYVDRRHSDGQLSAQDIYSKQVPINWRT